MPRVWHSQNFSFRMRDVSNAHKMTLSPVLTPHNGNKPHRKTIDEMRKQVFRKWVSGSAEWPLLQKTLMNFAMDSAIMIKAIKPTKKLNYPNECELKFAQERTEEKSLWPLDNHHHWFQFFFFISDCSYFGTTWKRRQVARKGASLGKRVIFQLYAKCFLMRQKKY